jgi:hypothetical protein
MGRALPVPIAERRRDWLFVGFWILNLSFITYIVDLEQLVIEDPSNFEYPLWYARPTWWRATIWIDALMFGPFYAFAIYAWIKGRDWIRVPSLVWSGLMFANVTIILFEETIGPHATPALGLVYLANAPWLLMPVATVWRLWRDFPFTRADS